MQDDNAPSTARVPLSNGKAFAVIDAEDEELVRAYGRWYLLRSKARPSKAEYAVCRIAADGSRTTTYLHRLVTNAPNGVVVDHVNGDGLDNRKQNLRFGTNAQNLANRKSVQTNNTSGYRGVSWFKGKWVAQINCKNQHYYLGRFSTPEEAALAFDRAAIIHFGEFAALNFPEAR